MTAFLIMVITIVSNMGNTRDLIVKVPLPDMETCAALLNSPAQFEHNFREFYNVVSHRTACEPREATRKNGVDHPEAKPS